MSTRSRTAPSNRANAFRQKPRLRPNTPNARRWRSSAAGRNKEGILSGFGEKLLGELREHVEIEWFVDDVDSRLADFIRKGFLRVAGHEQHFQAGPQRQTGFGQLIAVHARHLDVADEKIDTRLR